MPSFLIVLWLDWLFDRTPSGLPAAQDFEKKFQDKTKNKWANRADFKAAEGKYTLVEIDHSATAAQESKLAGLASPSKDSTPAAPPVEKYADSKLPPSTQNLMKLIFDKDMFN